MPPLHRALVAITAFGYATGCHPPPLSPVSIEEAPQSLTNNPFSETGTLPEAHSVHTATLLPDGRVLVIGGQGSPITRFVDNVRPEAALYDPPTGRFTSTGRLNTARGLHTATLLSGGTVLVTGGTRGGVDPLDGAESYDPATGVFTTLPSRMTLSRQAHTATLLQDGRVLIAGGYSTTGGFTATAELYDPATRTFTATGSMTAPRQLHTATLLQDGRVLILGGHDGQAMRSAELYDPATGTFSRTGDLNTSRFLHTATRLLDGTVLVAGGANDVSLATVEIYDPAQGVFGVTASMQGPRQIHTATLLSPSGAVLVTGGASEFQSTLALDSAELYDPASRQWRPAGTLSNPRERHTATRLASGDVLIAGGHDEGNALVAELYRPSSSLVSISITPTQVSLLAGTTYPFTVTVRGTTDTAFTWSVTGGTFTQGGVYTAPSVTESVTHTITVTSRADPTQSASATVLVLTTIPLGQSHSLHTATLLQNGRVLVAGGVNVAFTGAIPPAETSAALYDPAGSRFSATGSLATARALHTATSLATGTVLVTGGTSGGTNSLQSAELYDPNTGTFSATGAMNVARQGHTATRLADGRVLIVGGYAGTPAPGGLATTAELYDPVTRTFSSTPGSMATARQLHTATLLPDGRVLIVGGLGAGGPLTSMELYDPRTGRFTPGLSSLREGRYAHQTTLLPNLDNKVLVTGGISGTASDVVLQSAELHNPVTGQFVAPTNSMLFRRRSHTATYMSNGLVLIVGGSPQVDGLAANSVAELFDPCTKTFRAALPFTARQDHTATVLTNNDVLVVGGFNSIPVDNAQRYTPEAAASCTGGTCSSQGDPHQITLDGLRYNFQAAGEFIFVTDDQNFVVQVRQSLSPRNSRVAVNTALAARVGTHRVAFYRSEAPPLRIDGVPTQVGQDGIDLAGGGRITVNQSRYTIHWQTGEEMTVAVVASPALNSRLDIALALPAYRRGLVHGLMGNFDGLRSNDLTSRDGRVLPSSPSFAQLQRVFGDSWRITQAESLFDYPAGTGTANYTNLVLPSDHITTASLTQSAYDAARALCLQAGVTNPVLLDDCILDVGVTGDPSFADSAAEVLPPAEAVEIQPTTYFNDFDAGLAPNWSISTVNQTPGTPLHPRTGFLGQFGNDTATLSLSQLSPHTSVRVSFDLYIIGSMDGNDPFYGPDVWRVGVRGSQPLLQTTFANFSGQSYPDAYPGGSHPYQTGAAEVSTLGYQYLTQPADSVYRLTFTFPHTSDTLLLDFTGSGMEGIADESWGLDNVDVTLQ